MLFQQTGFKVHLDSTNQSCTAKKDQSNWKVYSCNCSSCVLKGCHHTVIPLTPKQIWISFEQLSNSKRKWEPSFPTDSTKYSRLILTQRPMKWAMESTLLSPHGLWEGNTAFKMERLKFWLEGGRRRIGRWHLSWGFTLGTLIITILEKRGFGNILVPFCFNLWFNTLIQWEFH